MVDHQRRINEDFDELEDMLEAVPEGELRNVRDLIFLWREILKEPLRDLRKIVNALDAVAIARQHIENYLTKNKC